MTFNRINLENNYQEIKAKIEAERIIKEKETIVKEIPYNDMVKLKWVPEAKTTKEKIIKLRAYFNIASLDLIPQVHNTIFRIGKKQCYSKYAISAWIEKGRKEAIGKKLSSFEKDKIKGYLNNLKRLTLLGQTGFGLRIKKSFRCSKPSVYHLLHFRLLKPVQVLRFLLYI